VLSDDCLAVILTNDIIEPSESVKQKEKCEDSNDFGNEGDNGGEEEEEQEEEEEEEVKKESNGRSKKGRWVSCTPFFFFPRVNFYSCLPLFWVS